MTRAERRSAYGASGRMRSRAVTRPVVGALVLAAGIGLAEVTQAQEAVPSGKPYRLNVHASTSYESNLAGGDNTIEMLRDVEPEDVRFNVGASLALELERAGTGLLLNLAFDAQRYANNRNLDGEDYSATARASKRFGLCSTSGVVGYSRTQSAARDLTVAVTKNVVEQRSGSATVVCGRRGLTVNAGGGVSESRNDATGGGFVDSRTVQASVGVGYSNDALGSLSITGQYSEGSYDRPAAIPATLVAEGFKQYGGGLAYSREVGRRLQGNMSVSYVRIEPDGVGAASSGLNALVALSYALGSRTSLSLSYGLGNEASSTVDADYVRSESVSFTGSYQLNSRLSVQAGVSASRDESKGGILTLLPVVRRNEQVTVSAGASWRIGRNLTATLDGAHSERTADVQQFNFKTDRVNIGLSANF